MDFTKTLQSSFNDDIGPYNLLNADLYMELATIYLSKMKIKTLPRTIKFCYINQCYEQEIKSFILQ